MHVDNKVFDNISFVSFHHRYVKPNIRTVLNNNHSQELVRFLGTASFHLKCFFFNLFSFFRFIFFNFLNPRRACVAAWTKCLKLFSSFIRAKKFRGNAFTVCRSQYRPFFFTAYY